MKELNFENKLVRMFNIDGNPWWAVGDVCKILGIANPRDAINRIKNHDVGTTDIIDRLGRKQSINIINEKGLYRLIFKSKKEEAKRFQDWVFEDVLPSLRKYGHYSFNKDIAKKSKQNRRLITDMWKKCGISEPKEYGLLTMEEYKCLFDNHKKKKIDMNKEEILILSAFEALESLNLHYNPVKGYLECKKSINKTSKVIDNVKYKELS